MQLQLIMIDKQTWVRRYAQFYVATQRAEFAQVRQIMVSRSKAVVTYYPRKTARRSYARELIRQMNHVWRVTRISSLSTIFREMCKINSRDLRRNGGTVALCQHNCGRGDMA